jgi:hypothetical protein
MICSADRRQASAFREMISIANTSESIRSRPYKKIAEGPLGQLFDALGRHHLVDSKCAKSGKAPRLSTADESRAC